MRPATVPLDALRHVRARAADDGQPPPSDRRLVRAAGALRVAAYTAGADAVGPPELLLLPHLLCTRADDAEDLEGWLVDRFAAPPAAHVAPGMRYLLGAVFERALMSDEGAPTALAQESASLVAALRVEEPLHVLHTCQRLQSTETVMLPPPEAPAAAKPPPRAEAAEPPSAAQASEADEGASWL